MSGIKQCGFCSLLSELLRRAMCVGSRRGSTDSYYRELGDRETLKIDDKSSQRSGDSDEFNVTFPQGGNGDALEETTIVRYAMDETTTELDNMPRRTLAGQFMTMHKRRRRRLLTRSLCKDEGLLDDLLLGQVQCILNQSAQWRFNAFTLDNVSGGRCLPVLCVHLFQMYGLISHFKLDVAKIWKLFSLIEEGYHSSNPYHNSIHAADVTQAMHCFLQQNKISDNMEPLEIMASLLAAIAHDMDHPGVNQPFLIATSNHLAALYKNTSVLENHHWRSAVSCIMESGLLDQMMDQRAELEHQMSSLILATDITRQQEYLSNFKTFLDTNTLDMTKPEHRHLVLQIALKCADISNPCRPWDISRKWSLKVCEEFFRQGDYERNLNLPITALCDRNNTSIPKIQTGFFKFVVIPLITEWHRFLKNDLSAQMLENLIYNQKKWEMLVAAELAEDTGTEISDADLVDDDLETSTNMSESSELLLPPPRRSSLNPTRQAGIKEQLRRFSVPLNVFQDSKFKSKDKAGTSSEADPRNQDYVSPANSDHSLHSELSLRGHCKRNEPDKVLSSEKLLPESSITSITTPLQATRLNSVIKHGALWKLVRQQTFPPLELHTRAHSLMPRSTSNEDCMHLSRNAKSDGGSRFDFNFRDGKLCNMFRRTDSDKTENDDASTELSGASGRSGLGSQLRDNLNSVQLGSKCSDLLNRRRKSMPADAATLTAKDKKVRDMREMLPELLRRTLSGKECWTRRRGSAPAPVVTSEFRGLASLGVLRHSINGGRRRASPMPSCTQWMARTAQEYTQNVPRRSSLPVEVLHPSDPLRGSEFI